MKPTLSEALLAAFGRSFLPGTESGGTGAGSGTGGTGTGGATTGGTTGGTGTLSAQARALIARANTEFDAAQKALKAGDFAEYGRQIDALKQTLSDLQSLQQK